MNQGHTGGNNFPSNSEHQQHREQQLHKQDSPAIVSDEILARRIKNRERQRRYRARKRLELDMRNSCLPDQYEHLQTDTHLFDLNPPPPHPSSFSVARTYSGGRNWKKDAREAGNLLLPLGNRAGRNWKADARNKAGPAAMREIMHRQIRASDVCDREIMFACDTPTFSGFPSL